MEAVGLTIALVVLTIYFGASVIMLVEETSFGWFVCTAFLLFVIGCVASSLTSVLGVMT